MTKKIVVSDNELTDIKRLKEIDAKLQKQKDILWNNFVLSKFKDETIREKLREINGQIIDVQIPLIEHEIRERFQDRKSKRRLSRGECLKIDN